ncbi:antibiotic biosynthesis monooxygenase [Niallia oryzisoli]|uniref:Antibiotic biosynthesis monooxygenase n=1 Tax=Niallia oryzisoli TaxID=1737571 RepID=A0ABZ2CG16_9BACI
MKMYITSGTLPYLKKLMTEHKDEQLVLMQKEDQFLLIHQTNGVSFFKEPRNYEIIADFGHFPESGFAVFHHIPVTDEGRPLFEYHFKNQAALINKVPDLTAIRVLRPLKSDTYLIFTVWKFESSYHLWKPTESFEEVYSKSAAENPSKKLPKVFPRSSFITKYTIVNEDD